MGKKVQLNGSDISHRVQRCNRKSLYLYIPMNMQLHTVLFFFFFCILCLEAIVICFGSKEICFNHSIFFSREPYEPVNN